MENRRAVIWSIAAATIAALFYWLSINKAVDNRVGDLDKKVIVLVANQDIPPETRIEPGMFREAAFPQAYLPPRTTSSAKEVLGQVAVAAIFEGEPILTSKIVPFDETSIDRRIPEGHRAITIGIRDDQDVVGVGGMLRPGHFIDILITHFISTEEIEKGGQGAQYVANIQKQANLKAEVRTVFQNVKILAIGQDTRLQTANVNRSADSGRGLTNKNITVALTPEDVQKLVLAQSTGRVTISLRRFNDTQISKLDYLDPFKAFGIQRPLVQGPQPAYREIRGGQVFATPF